MQEHTPPSPPSPPPGENRPPPAEKPRTLGRALAAVLVILVSLLVGVVGSFVATGMAFPLLSTARSAYGIEQERPPEPWLRVWAFKESSPGSGDRHGLTRTLATAGFSVRWHFEDSGAKGRVALECGERCFDQAVDESDPTEPSIAALFRERGYTLDLGEKLRRDYRGGLNNGWAQLPVVVAWSSLGMYLPLLALALIGRRATLTGAPPAQKLSLARSLLFGVGLGTGDRLIRLADPQVWANLKGQLSSIAPGSVELAMWGPVGFVLGLLLGVVVAPLVEELFFRGWAFPLLDERAGRWTAYLVSAGLWSAVHLDIAATPWLLVTGVALAWAYQRSGSLVVPITAHATSNALVLGLVKVMAPPF